MLVLFSISPFGVGDHLAPQVARAVALVLDSGLPCQVTAMGTLVEGEWDEVMPLIDRCRRTLLEECPRVALKIWIDDKPGASGTLTGKVASLERELGRPLPGTR